MTSSVFAFAAHLPILTFDQVDKVSDWAQSRSRDYQVICDENGAHLYAVLEEERNQKSLINLLNTNLANWKVKRPKYRRGWLEPLTCKDYLAIAGPSPSLQDVVRRVLDTVANYVVEKIEAAQRVREGIVAKTISEVETSIIRGTLSAWKEMADGINSMGGRLSNMGFKWQEFYKRVRHATTSWRISREGVLILQWLDEFCLSRHNECLITGLFLPHNFCVGLLDG